IPASGFGSLAGDRGPASTSPTSGRGLPNKSLLSESVSAGHCCESSPQPPDRVGGVTDVDTRLRSSPRAYAAYSVALPNVADQGKVLRARRAGRGPYPRPRAASACDP